MKKFLKSDYFLMFTSVAVAMLLWVYVSYSQNPIHETWVKGVNITYTNETTELESGKIVIVGGNIKTADLKLRGSRTALATVRTSNIVCDVNLGKIKDEGVYNIPLVVNVGVDGVTVVQKNPYNVTLKAERVVTKEKEITVNIVGDPKAEYSLGEMEINPEVVKITGPESVIDSVHSVVATVDVADATQNLEGLYKIKLYNEAGKEITDERLSKNIEYCDVRCSVKYVKNIKVTPVLSDETNGDGRAIIVSDVTPETVAVSGNKEVIDNITELYTKKIDTSEIIEKTVVETAIDLSAYSENIVVETETVSVTLEPDSGQKADAASETNQGEKLPDKGEATKK